jgi:hypothetical protein
VASARSGHQTLPGGDRSKGGCGREALIAGEVRPAEVPLRRGFSCTCGSRGPRGA